MIEITLSRGDSVRIRLQGADGLCLIRYGNKAVIIKADLPDNSGRNGIIYEERYLEDYNTPDDESVEE